MQPERPSYRAPPSSDIEPDQRFPPSPPQSPRPRIRSNVDRLLTFLRLRKSGRPVAYPTDCDCKTFRLGPTHFDELQRRLGEDERLRSWSHCKARYDYDPAEEEFVLRMPSAVHEIFLANVEDAISNAITALADRLAADRHEETAASLRKIYKGRNTTLELHAPKLENSSESSQSSAGNVPVQRSPDASFFHPEGVQPALVLEVSYSQQRKVLPRIAESYIVDSRHEIRCVMGLDVTYTSGKKKDKTATVSVWRPGMEKDEKGDDVGTCVCDLNAVAFRDRNGSACEGELELLITDLVPHDLLDILPESVRTEAFTISFAQLTELLVDPKNSPDRQTKNLPKKFRKRKRTPSEELSDHREEAFMKHEEAGWEKAHDADGEWSGPARKKQVGQGSIEVVECRRSKRNKSGRAVGEPS